MPEPKPDELRDPHPRGVHKLDHGVVAQGREPGPQGRAKQTIHALRVQGLWDSLLEPGQAHPGGRVGRSQSGPGQVAMELPDRHGGDEERRGLEAFALATLQVGQNVLEVPSTVKFAMGYTFWYLVLDDTSQPERLFDREPSGGLSGRESQYAQELGQGRKT